MSTTEAAPTSNNNNNNNNNNSTNSTSEAVQENQNKNNNKKPNPELFRIHGFSIENERDVENKKRRKNYFLHSLTFSKIASPIAEFQEIMPVRLERRKFGSFDEMNRDANRIGAYMSKVVNDVTHLNDPKIMQFLNDRANMREIKGKNPVSELLEVLGLSQFQHAAVKEKDSLDQSYQIAASGIDSGYYTEHRITNFESTGFCNRRAEGTNVWLSCCPLQPPERLKDLGQRLLYSSFVIREG
jgi:hypothetical protein